jgi:hypothetical protein
MASTTILLLATLAAGPAVSVHVAAKPTHEISPYIYGASAVPADKAIQYGLTTVRWGGNRSSRYNWKARADNAGSDWFFLNGKADSWSDFVAANRKAGLASYLTVPLLPWVAKGSEGWSFSVAKYGLQKAAESYVPDRGNGLRPDGTPITGNDPRETSIPSTPAFQAEGIRTLRLPADGPPRLYALDNEPMLWSHTHRDVHPEPPSYDEVFARGRDYALAIKGADPKGLIGGPCTWGWTDLTYSALDEGKDRYATHADHKAHGGIPFLAWYLARMKAESDRLGKRLLDVVDVHYYPQGQADGQMVYGGKSPSDAMRALRLRSTRCLWDKTYRDESWIKEPVMLIPRVREWVGRNNPGTRLAIGEYNWGGDDDPSGAVAQADVLGIFARERVDFAYFWAGLDGVQRFAFALYRNPDGRGKGFGETYLPSMSDAPDRIAAFGALRSDGATTVVLINKELHSSVEVALSLDGRPAPSSAELFRLPNPPGPIRREAWKATAGKAVVTLPPLTAAMLVVPPSRP